MSFTERTPDVSDAASAAENAFTESRIKHYREQAAHSRMVYSGFCYYCNSRIRQPLVFCDKGCQEDYEHEQKMRRINGKR
jgi:hypothetical protein